MTKHEFQSALRERLSGLPAEDVAATVAYYREMIEDRMEDGLTEEEAVAALGPLEDVLASVLSDLPPAQSEPTPCFSPVTYVDQPFDSLSIDGNSSDVQLLPSDDGTCRVDFGECDDLRFSVEVVDGVLNVRREDVQNVESLVTVYLPETAYDRLTVQTDIGDVKLSGVNCATLTLRTNSGDAELSDMTAERLDGENYSGNVTLSGVTCETPTLRTDIGDLKLSAVTCGTLTLRTKSGDAELSEVTAERLDGETYSGNVTLSGVTCETPTLRTDIGDLKLSAVTCGTPTLQTGSGDVTLSDVTCETLTLRTHSGDIVLTNVVCDSTPTLQNDIGDIKLSAVTCETLTLQTASGDAELSDVTCETLTLQTYSGDIKLSAVTCGTLTLRTDMGGIDLTDVACDGTLTLRTDSGDTELSDVTAERLDVGSVGGDVTLFACDAQTVRLQCDGGNIHAILRSGKQFSAHSSVGKVRVPESTPGAGECELITESGTIRVIVE